MATRMAAGSVPAGTVSAGARPFLPQQSARSMDVSDLGTSTRTDAGRRAVRRRDRRGVATPNRMDRVDRPSGAARAGITTVERRLSPVSAGSACPPAERPYRMSRWARLATTVTVLAVGALALWAALSGAGPVVQDLVVQSGDTLVSIAERAQPTADTAAVVAEILELNTLDGMEPWPGQVLQVPVAS